jgi:hypothetical protein
MVRHTKQVRTMGVRARRSLPTHQSGRAGTLGLCLLAMLALAAVTASAASAGLPELGGCEATPVGHGKYSDPACTVKATGAAKKTEGAYEWYTGANFAWVNDLEHHVAGGQPEQAFEVGIAATTFETTEGHKIECSGGTGHMRMNLEKSTKEVYDGVFDFEGCHEVGGEEAECASPNYEGGAEINDYGETPAEGFHGTLGFLKGKGGSEPKVGLSLTSFRKYAPESKTAEVLMYAVCQGPLGTVWIGGEKKGGNAVISLIEPVDTMTENYTQTYAATTAGVQQWGSFEGKHNSVLDEYVLHSFEPSAWVTSFTDFDEYPIEIKAKP